MKITVAIATFLFACIVSTPVQAACDTPTCAAITAFYKNLGKDVKHCMEDTNRHILYWDIETKNGQSWDEAKSECALYCPGKSDLTKVADATEFGNLKQLLPGKKIDDHWLNFRLDKTQGKSLFEALIKHGWKWEDGTNFTYGTDNWDGDTGHCDNFGSKGACLLFWPEATFGLDPCNNSKIALCRMSSK